MQCMLSSMCFRCVTNFITLQIVNIMRRACHVGQQLPTSKDRHGTLHIVRRLIAQQSSVKCDKNELFLKLQYIQHLIADVGPHTRYDASVIV